VEECPGGTGSGSPVRNTWKKYLSVLKTFEKFFTSSLPSKALDFSENTFVAFAIWCKNAGLSAASSRSYISTLRTMAALLGFKIKKKYSKAVKIVLKGAENRFEKISQGPEGYKMAEGKQSCRMGSLLPGLFWSVQGR
jgi:hypothetical protein